MAARGTCKRFLTMLTRVTSNLGSVQTASRAEHGLLPSPACASRWRGTGTMWPRELLKMSPQKSICVWTGICQQFHQTMLDWHIMEKKLRLIQTVSAFCICGFPDRWTWLTTPNYQTECHFAMAAANHASDFSVLTQDQRFPFFSPPNRKLISNSIITTTTTTKKSISQQIYVWKIRCYNYREIIILSFWGNVITAISSLGYSFTI